MKFWKAYRNQIFAAILVIPVIIVMADWTCYCQIYRHSGKMCVYDLIGLGMQNVVTVMVFVLFLVIYPFKEQFRSTVLVRQCKVHKLWCKMIRRLVAIGIVYAGYFGSIVCIMPLMFTKDICNWSDTNSFLFYKTGKVSEKFPSFVNMFAACYVTVFAAFLISGMIMLFVWWYTQTPIVGYIVSIGFAILDYTGFHIYFANTSMSSFIISREGIVIWKHYVFPILAVVLIFIVFSVLYRQRDMLKKDFQL